MAGTHLIQGYSIYIIKTSHEKSCSGHFCMFLLRVYIDQIYNPESGHVNHLNEDLQIRIHATFSLSKPLAFFILLNYKKYS